MLPIGGLCLYLAISGNNLKPEMAASVEGGPPFSDAHISLALMLITILTHQPSTSRRAKRPFLRRSFAFRFWIPETLAAGHLVGSQGMYVCRVCREFLLIIHAQLVKLPISASLLCQLHIAYIYPPALCTVRPIAAHSRVVILDIYI